VLLNSPGFDYVVLIRGSNLDRQSTTSHEPDLRRLHGIASFGYVKCEEDIKSIGETGPTSRASRWRNLSRTMIFVAAQEERAGICEMKQTYTAASATRGLAQDVVSLARSQADFASPPATPISFCCDARLGARTHILSSPRQLLRHEAHQKHAQPHPRYMSSRYTSVRMPQACAPAVDHMSIIDRWFDCAQ